MSIAFPSPSIFPLPLCSRWQPCRKWTTLSKKVIDHTTLLLQKRHPGTLIWRYCIVYRLYREFQACGTSGPTCLSLSASADLFCLRCPQLTADTLGLSWWGVLRVDFCMFLLCWAGNQGYHSKHHGSQCPLVWGFSCGGKNPETKCVFHQSRSEYRVINSLGLRRIALKNK